MIDQSFKFFDPEGQGAHNPSDEDYLVCQSHVPGFSLVFKRWGWFDVAAVRDWHYNADAFEALVLPSDKKRMIQSLVTQCEQVKTSFDDLVAGKGKGLIMLLHGPPGVGKTFTAGMSLTDTMTASFSR